MKRKLKISAIVLSLTVGAVLPTEGVRAEQITTTTVAQDSTKSVVTKGVNPLIRKSWKFTLLDALNPYLLPQSETELGIEKNKTPTLSEEIIETSTETSVEDIEYESDYEVYSNSNYSDMLTPSNNGFKSYMDAKYITSPSSAQYALKQQYSLDYSTGIYTVDGRWCIAVGSYYSTTVGTYIDLIMENGSIVPCILADCKSDAHTDSTRRQNENGSIVEFVVDSDTLIPNISNRWGNTGDVSNASSVLQGEIAYIRVYN